MKHILKNQLSSGEISELLEYRTDTDRYFQGSLTAKNGRVLPQGGFTRRSGTKYVADISTLMNTVGVVNAPPRLVPFTFNESQAYTLVFFPHSSGTTRVAFATGTGLVEDSASPGNPYIYEITGVFDHEAFDYCQSGDTLFMTQTGRTPLKLVRTAIDNWAVSTLAFTAAPTDWSGVLGWPELVSIFEQRLVFGANLSRPQTLWFSKAGDFTNFDISSPVVDSDAITITLDNGEPNRMLWLSSAQRLLIGTVGNEWSVRGVSGPITPTSIQAQKETNQGSQKLKPNQVGPVTLFLEKFGNTVNQMAFDFNINSYNVVDLSILSPHLTQEYPIVNWGYQKDPGNVLWAIREDGECLSLTYQREHGVLAWTTNDTDGSFLDATCIPGTRDTDAWFVIQRNIDGVEKYYLEKLGPTLRTEDPKDGKFLDCYIEYSGAATDTITGLDHLEGKTISVLGDGMVLPDVTVASGSVTLAADVTEAILGLPFESDLIPLIPDSPDEFGSMVSRYRKLDQISIMMYRSCLVKNSFYIDGVLQPLEQIPFRDPDDDPLLPIPLYTGIKVIDHEPYQGRETKILIRQDQPLPMTILAVAFRVTVQEK